MALNRCFQNRTTVYITCTASVFVEPDAAIF